MKIIALERFNILIESLSTKQLSWSSSGLKFSAYLSCRRGEAYRDFLRTESHWLYVTIFNFPNIHFHVFQSLLLYHHTMHFNTITFDMTFDHNPGWRVVQHTAWMLVHETAILKKQRFERLLVFLASHAPGRDIAEILWEMNVWSCVTNNNVLNIHFHIFFKTFTILWILKWAPLMEISSYWYEKHRFREVPHTDCTCACAPNSFLGAAEVWM